MKLLEGRFRLGARVALVVELLTTGQGTIDAIDLVRQAGGEVVVVVALLEEFDGAWAMLQQHGVPSYHPVFTRADFDIPKS
jgi:orotate phosphoribosyltransferase